jgi:hypothetical protein
LSILDIIVLSKRRKSFMMQPSRQLRLVGLIGLQRKAFRKDPHCDKRAEGLD